MRILIVTIIGLVFITMSCKNSNFKDVSEIDELMKVTDSLSNVVQKKFESNSKKLYMLADDSVRLDDLVWKFIPDSVGAYQYLEQRITKLEEMVNQIKREISFANDQLMTLKNDYLDGEINKTKYKSDIYNLKDMVEFLKIRVDSNILLINKQYDKFFKFNSDSVPR